MILKKVEFVGSAVTKSQFPDNNLAQIVFSGRSNVGKSSFINALLNRKNMARVSQTPGKTRLINFFLINDGFYFVDIPGYGYARVSKKMILEFQAMIETYLLSEQISF
ncbi:MAG: ribosome biogenesis GTP-binding protein YsxC, partial [Tenericutes bacterium]|nr:ribosome biogenesis GTP-binding protein YsxC [Mycoplasmatota bacterium]